MKSCFHGAGGELKEVVVLDMVRVRARRRGSASLGVNYGWSKLPACGQF